MMTKRDFLMGTSFGLAAACANEVSHTLWPHQLFKKKKHIAPEEEGRVASYAQSGEDLVVSFLFDYVQKVDKPSYIDIGACHPTIHNNTYLFYLRGARGVLVEPNVGLIPALTSIRPHDTVLNIGIGVSDQEAADFYVTDSVETNTFVKEEAEKRQIVKVVKMPLVNVNKVMAEHCGKKGPDFFSIDVEGLDFDILKTLDFARFRPAIFCVETVVYGTTDLEQEVIDFMASKGYVARAQTLPNSIFIDRNILKKV
jgi:FkbM family methyltransferase